MDFIVETVSFVTYICGTCCGILCVFAECWLFVLKFIALIVVGCIIVVFDLLVSLEGVSFIIVWTSSCFVGGVACVVWSIIVITCRRRRRRERCRFIGRRRYGRARSKRSGSACCNKRIRKFLVPLMSMVLVVGILLISAWKVGAWQWPMRGWRIGEASLPGPPFNNMYVYGNEDAGDSHVTQGSAGVMTPNSLHYGLEVEMLDEEDQNTVNDLFGVDGAGGILEDFPVHIDPPPPVHPVPILRCPLCTGYTTKGPTRGLMAHLTWKHFGQCLPEPACVVLRGLDRGMCCGEGCGAVRPIASRLCPRCSNTRPPRRLEEGDCIGGVAGARRREEITMTTYSNFEDPSYREDFSKRVADLPPTSVVHIPISLRQRHAIIMAELLEGMAEGNAASSILEFARTKLLLGPIPRKLNARCELARRLERWKAGLYDELLVRAEEQCRSRCGTVSKKLRGTKNQYKTRRARMLVGEGAYSKAAASLQTDVADLEDKKQLEWAEKLLPNSTRPDAARAHSTEPPDEVEASRGYALAGVHFRAMSAPGPSGARPEHLREFVAVRNRRIASRLLQAISKFVDAATAGYLTIDTRWILDSRLVFLKKKNSNTPRPVRVGELLRRVVAKRMVESNRTNIKEECFKARQFGVAVPGGADALIHFRGELAKKLKQSGIAIAAIDVDFQNAFPSLEWDSIRSAVNNRLSNLLAWTEWCHADGVTVYLPSGEKVRIDRGAEQGDPLGSIYCALVLADVMDIVRAKLDAKSICAFDFWYMDDGQIFCDARYVDTVLQTLDEVAAEVGAARGRGSDAKSVVRLLGQATALEAVDRVWCTDHVAATTKPIPESGGHVLGIDFEDQSTIMS